MTDKQREYIEKKARELIDRIDDVYPALRSITYWENFVLNLLNEAPKPKVSKGLIQKIQCLLLDVAEKETGVVLAIAKIVGWLMEAGFEVED